MGKKENTYLEELRAMVEGRTGSDEDTWLLPQLRLVAMQMALLDKMHGELLLSDIMNYDNGKSEVHPLLAHYDKMQRTLVQQLGALGLNYSVSPKRVKEDARKGVAEDDPMKVFYEQAKK